MPALISNIRIFATNTASATKFGDEEDNGVLFKPVPIKPLP